MLLLSPLLGAIAIVVKSKIGSPILFCQVRPGKKDPKTGKEKLFKLYKFVVVMRSFVIYRMGVVVKWNCKRMKLILHGS